MSSQPVNMPFTEQVWEVDCHSTNALNTNANTDFSKHFTFNPQAEAFNPGPQIFSNLSPSTLNPLAAFFSPDTTSIQPSNLSPETAIISPLSEMQSSALLATSLVPAPENSKRTTPQATLFSPASIHPSSTLNALAPVFQPNSSQIPHNSIELTDDIEAQHESHGSVSPKTEDGSLEDCSQEELRFPENETPSCNTPDMSSANISNENDEDCSSSFCSSTSTADEIEYSNQQCLLYQDSEIHHINWLGQGVIARTTTPSAVSLAIALMPAPARYVDGDDLRSKTVLREAMLTIDPVVFYGDLNAVKDLKGERLREALIGSTSPYYTTFGWWKEDSYGEDDERPLTDELDMTRYIDGVTVVNGWLDNGAPTRQHFWKDADENYLSVLATRKKAQDKRKHSGLKNTPLCNTWTADGSDSTSITKQGPSGDASGLVTMATLSYENTKCSSSPVWVEKDDLFKNATWADDLDDEDDSAPIVETAVVEQNDLFKHSNWADDLDDDEFIAKPSFDLPIRAKQVTDPNPNMTSAEYLAEGMALYAAVRKNFEPKASEIVEATDILKSEGEISSGEESGQEDSSLESEDGELVKEEFEGAYGEFERGHSLDLCPAVVAPLSCKNGLDPGHMRSMTSDHTKMVIPKFNLVPASLQSMLSTDAERSVQKLEEITEEEEDSAQHDDLSDINGQPVTAADEEAVAARVDLAASMGHVVLRRSPFCENLSALVSAHAEDENSSEPSTPEQSPVPSPYKRPASNTPNRMLGKNVRFSSPGVDQDASSTEEPIGTAGVGAIFDDQEEVADDSSILSGAVTYGADQVFSQTALASHSVVALLHTGSSCGSQSLSDDIFTAPSTFTSAPTTVEGSEEGSPSPSLVPRPAKRPNLVAELVSLQDIPPEPVLVQMTAQKCSSGWASIKRRFARKPSAGFTDAANVQFIPTRRPSSSWSKVGNKLQKPRHLGPSLDQKQKAGFRKAVKKVKQAFVKGFKALA